MRDLLFTLLERLPFSTFAVKRVEEPDYSSGSWTSKRKWRVEIKSGSKFCGATAPWLDDAIKLALKGVDFEPSEADCDCFEPDGSPNNYKDGPCVYHTWNDPEED